MDAQVLAAMARWPNVPDVYGWLSLSARGMWQLRPGGRPDSPVDPITNARTTDFIGRNYLADARGCWFFQNGPQRVFVQLEAAPWILHTDCEATGATYLKTHTQERYGPVTHWWLDEHGHLYAQAAQGAGLVEGRDLPQLLEQLHTPQGTALDALEGTLTTPDTQAAPLRLALGTGPEAPLGHARSEQIARCLGFIRKPQPDAKIPA